MKEEKSLPTLGEFIIEKQRDFKYSTGELSRLISCLQIASKMVNHAINKAGIANVLGAVGNQNVQGEEQQKLDVIANETFIKHIFSAFKFIIYICKFIFLITQPSHCKNTVKVLIPQCFSKIFMLIICNFNIFIFMIII